MATSKEHAFTRVFLTRDWRGVYTIYRTNIVMRSDVIVFTHRPASVDVHDFVETTLAVLSKMWNLSAHLVQTMVSDDKASVCFVRVNMHHARLRVKCVADDFDTEHAYCMFSVEYVMRQMPDVCVCVRQTNDTPKTLNARVFDETATWFEKKRFAFYWDACLIINNTHGFLTMDRRPDDVFLVAIMA